MTSKNSSTTTPSTPNERSRQEYELAVRMAVTGQDVTDTVVEKSNSRGLEVAVKPEEEIWMYR